jgi:hypothetical protein
VRLSQKTTNEAGKQSCFQEEAIARTGDRENGGRCGIGMDLQISEIGVESGPIRGGNQRVEA